jgi:hypothetical protein
MEMVSWNRGSQLDPMMVSKTAYTIDDLQQLCMEGETDRHEQLDILS